MDLFTASVDVTGLYFFVHKIFFQHIKFSYIIKHHYNIRFTHFPSVPASCRDSEIVYLLLPTHSVAMALKPAGKYCGRVLKFDSNSHL